jgi:hypothetical protein
LRRALPAALLVAAAVTSSADSRASAEGRVPQRPKGPRVVALSVSPAPPAKPGAKPGPTFVLAQCDDRVVLWTMRGASVEAVDTVAVTPPGGCPMGVAVARHGDEPLLWASFGDDFDPKRTGSPNALSRLPPRQGAAIWNVAGTSTAFACALAVIADVSGDGIPDLAVGDPLAGSLEAPPGQPSGKPFRVDPSLRRDSHGDIHVHSGGDGRRLRTLEAPAGAFGFGARLIARGSGPDDAVVLASAPPGPRLATGKPASPAMLFLADLATGKVLASVKDGVRDPGNSSAIAWSPGAKDGRGWLVGSEGSGASAGRGSLALHHADTLAPLFRAEGASRDLGFGESVAAYRDATGRTRIAAGASWRTPDDASPGTSDGKGAVLVGPPDGTAPSSVLALGIDSGRCFGIQLAAVGDLDGDGGEDLLVGMRPAMRADAPRARVVLVAVCGATGKVLAELSVPEEKK